MFSRHFSLQLVDLRMEHQVNGFMGCDYNIERCFGWMDNCRRLVVRYERSVEHYQAFCLVAIILWCLNLILK